MTSHEAYDPLCHDVILSTCLSEKMVVNNVADEKLGASTVSVDNKVVNMEKRKGGANVAEAYVNNDKEEQAVLSPTKQYRVSLPLSSHGASVSNNPQTIILFVTTWDLQT